VCLQLCTCGLLLAALLAHTVAAREQAAAPPPTVILISLDGTRPADVDAQTLPTLVELAARGARSPGLIPATPANTFPGHVTLVTGVGPDRHGVVNNFFLDSERGAFRKRDIPSWIEVEPLWSWLEQRGVVTASYHWVGSEGAWPAGRAPTHWKAFSASTPPKKKVATILSWLDREDPAERPRFITSWFPGVDHVAHRDGPGSATARARLARQDAAFAALRVGLEERGLWSGTTLLVVSDHGMVAARRRLDFDRVLEDAGVRARVYGLGGFANVYLDGRFEGESERIAAKRAVERVAEAHGVEAIEVGAPGSEPFTHPRFGDLVLRVDPGTAFHRPGLPSGGYHGYDSEAPEMHGVFFAFGRGVEPGRRLGVLRAIDVAPTVLALLGFEAPDWMEGSPIGLSSGEPAPSETPIEAPNP